MSLTKSHSMEGYAVSGFAAVREAFADNFTRRGELGGACCAYRGSELPHDEERVYARNFEVPSGGAVGTAGAIAHAYSVFATGGRELGDPRDVALREARYSALESRRAHTAHERWAS